MDQFCKCGCATFTFGLLDYNEDNQAVVECARCERQYYKDPEDGWQLTENDGRGPGKTAKPGLWIRSRAATTETAPPPAQAKTAPE